MSFETTNSPDEQTAPPVSDPVDNQPPGSDPDPVNPEREKRGAGRTGPISFIGKAISSFNATKHGLCSKTLILPSESLDEWVALYARWQKEYGLPAEDTLLADFVLKTAQAEWYRLRAQRHYDFFVALNDGLPIFTWHLDQIKQHDLMLRYLTTAERKFQREQRQLELHYKNKLLAAKIATAQEAAAAKKSAAAQAAAEAEAEEEPYEAPDISYKNADTGQVMLSDGTILPPPPGYIPEKIIPGVYGPLHPSNWRSRNQPKK
jgi:hypothetical protein